MLGFTPLSAAPLSSVGERIVLASAAITGRATVTATAGAVMGSAAITGKATVTAIGYRTQQGQAAITSAATVTAIGGYLHIGSAAVNSTGTITADAFVQQEQPIRINSVSTVSCIAEVSHFTVPEPIVSSANIVAIGYIYGEEWTKQVAGSDIWLKQG